MSCGRRALALLALVVALWPLHDRLFAHSGLRFSSPLDGATLGDSPTAVQLTFLEPPEPSLSTIRVVDTSGAAYQDGAPQPVADDPLSLTVHLRPLGRGIYTVHWRVVSAVDGHASAGVFVFGVLMSPSGPIGAASVVETTASTPEAMARSIFLTGVILLLGAAAAHIGRFGLGRELRVALAGWIVAVVGLVWLAILQRRVAGVGVAELMATAVGRALVWRIVVIGAAGMFLGLARRGTRATRPPLVHLGVWGLALATLAAVAVHSAAGHAGAGRWPLVASLGSQIVHIAAAGIWLGGLAALLAGVGGVASNDKAIAVRRFSNLAAAGLVAVIATGVVRSAIEISALSDLTSTTYGRLLLVKAALAAGIAALGAVNRWRSTPRATSTLQPLRRTASGELSLTAAAVAAAGFLGTLAPPAASQSTPGIVASGADFATTVRVRLTAASDYPGLNRFFVHVDDYDSGAPVRADRVSLRFTPLDDPGIPSTSLPLVPGPEDVYAASGANVAFDGRWRIGVHVERAGSSVEVPLDIETRSPSHLVSIQRMPGQATLYTVFLRRLGFVRFTPEAERPGRSQVIVSCFDVISDYKQMDQIVVTARAADGSEHQVPVRRLDRNRYAAEVDFHPGPNRLVAVARSADGTRMRATVEIDVPHK